MRTIDCFFLSILFFLSGLALGIGYSYEAWRRDLVERGLAEWKVNSSGSLEWTWKSKETVIEID